MRVCCLVFAGLVSLPCLVEAREDDRQAQQHISRESVAFSADGIPIHFEVRGERTAGPSLVLIHGWSHDGRFWEPHSTTLAATYPIVVMDLAGFGRSGTGRPDWNMEAFGQDVAAVVDTLNLEQVVLVGFSMGAPVALEAALQMTDVVVGVILVDALKNPTEERPEEEIQRSIASWREEYGSREWVRRVGFDEAAPSVYVDRCLAMIAPTPPERWWEALAEARRWTGRRAREVLERIDVPVAAIANDRMPIDTMTYRRYLPSFLVRTIPGVGHLGVLWQEPQQFDRYVLEIVQAWTGTKATLLPSATADKTEVAAFAHYARSGEHGSESSTGILWRLSAIADYKDLTSKPAVLPVVPDIGPPCIAARTWEFIPPQISRPPGPCRGGSRASVTQPSLHPHSVLTDPVKLTGVYW